MRRLCELSVDNAGSDKFDFEFTVRFYRFATAIALLILLVLTPNLPGGQPSVSRAPAGPNSIDVVLATFTPDHISENFAGFIQLTITGLDPGDPVLVEKFQVNNDGGNIDGSAILEQSFVLVDGQSNLIDGVANVNVPSDSTPVDGKVVTQLSFLDHSLQGTPGDYVFRFSSPINEFVPLTRRFTVVATDHAQNISGTVTAGSAPVPNAYVVLLKTAGGGYHFQAGTIADPAGHYSFGAEAGQYDLVAIHRGYVSPFGKGVEQNLVAGQNKTVNIPMLKGTRTISGRVSDRRTSEGLAGLQVKLESTDGNFTVDYTDASGNFNTSVTPGRWRVFIECDAVNQAGYLAPSRPVTVDVSSGNVSNLALPLIKAAALFYGKLTDTDNNPIPGVEISSGDELGQFETSTVTDQAGNYVIAVNSGVSKLSATPGALQEKGFLSSTPASVYVPEGHAKRADFTATKSNAQFSGSLQDNNGIGVSDVTYEAADETNHRVTHFGTEQNGAFSAGLTEGTWSLVPTFETAANTDLIFITPPLFILAKGQNLSAVSLQAQRPARHIVIHVINNTGMPYEGAEVKITAATAGKTYTAFAYTDGTGTATLPAFDASWTISGNTVQLLAAGFRALPSQTVTVSGSDVNLTLQLELLPATGNTLVNLSTRGTVQAGEDALIGGFIVPGLAPKKVLLRAIGPSLASFGVNGAVNDTTLTLFDGMGAEIGFNDDWTSSPDKQAIIDTTAPPSNDRESAIIATLEPGSYTARVSGAGKSTGVALIELYDLDSFSSSTLANISTRGRVSQGQNVLITGYIVGGYASQRVVVRGLGPSLTQFGVAEALADPFLELHNGQGATIASNNDWQETQKQELIDTTIPPSDPRESAIVIDLQPGNYTAVITGAGGSTGLGLAEVYNITKN